MKGYLIAIIVLVCAVCTSHGQSTTEPDEVLVSYWAYKKNIRTVISDLHDQSKVNISYADDIMPRDKKVFINVKSKPLGTALDQILKNTGLKYETIGNQIIIIEDEYAGLVNDSYTISGIIQDSLSNERLIFANVYLDDGQKGVESNEFGFYTIKVPKGEQELNVSYIGYPKYTLPLKVRRDTVINIKISPSILLKEIVIIDDKLEKREEIEDAVILPIPNLNSMASLGGEPDLIRMVQTLAGVTSAADGFGGIHVRGGSVDQNLILLDGVPVYSPSHTFGLFSIFNPSAIQSAKLIKNGFPARYGGRLSSVLDIVTKDGNRQKFSGSMKLNLPYTASASLEGPLDREKSSFFISARRTTLDPAIKAFTNFLFDAATESGESNYYFYDLNAKLNLQLSKNHRWYFTAYTGRDHFINNRTSIFEEELDFLIEEDNNQWDWGNNLASFRWNMILGKNASANVKTYYSKFNFELFDLDRSSLKLVLDDPAVTILNFAELYVSNIEDIGGQIDFQIQPSNHFTSRFGINYVQHTFDPGIVIVDQNLDNTPDAAETDKSSVNALLEKDNLVGSETRAHLENIFSFGRSRINAGMHAVMINTGSETEFIIEPRFTMALHLFKNTFLKASYAQMDQYMHFLSGSGLGLPNEFWLPSTDLIKPELSTQYSAGLDISLGRSWFFNVTGFYKSLSNIVTYPDDGEIFDVNSQNNWENNVAVGEGTAQGIEASLSKDVGKFTSQINYTYSKSDRKFDDINNGNSFPYRFDRRHVFNISSVFKFSDNGEFAMNWTYGSGIPYTKPEFCCTVENVGGIEKFFPITTSRHNERFPANHRLDLTVNFFTKIKRASIRYSIGVHNVYANKNALYTDLVRTESNTNPFEQVFYYFPSPFPFVSIDFYF